MNPLQKFLDSIIKEVKNIFHSTAVSDVEDAIKGMESTLNEIDPALMPSIIQKINTETCSLVANEFTTVEQVDAFFDPIINGLTTTKNEVIEKLKPPTPTQN